MVLFHKTDIARNRIPPRPSVPAETARQTSPSTTNADPSFLNMILPCIVEAGDLTFCRNNPAGGATLAQTIDSRMDQQLDVDEACESELQKLLEPFAKMIEAYKSRPAPSFEAMDNGNLTVSSNVLKRPRIFERIYHIPSRRSGGHWDVDNALLPPIVVPIPFFLTMIPVSITVPVVAMRHPAATTFPVTFKVFPAFITRSQPTSTRIR